MYIPSHCRLFYSSTNTKNSKRNIEYKYTPYTYSVRSQLQFATEDIYSLSVLSSTNLFIVNIIDFRRFEYIHHTRKKSIVRAKKVQQRDCAYTMYYVTIALSFTSVYKWTMFNVKIFLLDAKHCSELKIVLLHAEKIQCNFFHNLCQNFILKTNVIRRNMLKHFAFTF